MKIKAKEIILTICSTAIALVFGLMLIRWLQPSLLGVSHDMVLTSSSEEAVPYYENIFRLDDLLSKSYILKDPIIKNRAKQLYPDEFAIGPNDILGFRNDSIPNTTDVVIIGDSQTYGINAHMVENWPHSFKRSLTKDVFVYSMATGGWGAVQYYYAVTKALYLKPKIIIVAFYTGNDPLETFSMTYGADNWKQFISDSKLNKYDAPKFNFPVPEDEKWPVNFSDGVKTIFTPALRHASNKDHPAIDAAYLSMIKIANEITKLLDSVGIKIFFTIIPTKEFAYEKKIENEKIDVDPVYKLLIKDEGKRIDEFSYALQSIERATYVNVIDALQEAVLQSAQIYPSDADGHPLAKGYMVIGETIAKQLDGILKPNELNGMAVLQRSNSDIKVLVYIDKSKYWFVDVQSESDVTVDVNHIIEKRDLKGFEFSGHKSLKEVISIE
jgi:hypothetical protein